jgi:hypothetical protein
VFGAPDECPPNTFQVGTFNGGQFTNDVAFTLIVPSAKLTSDAYRPGPRAPAVAR